MKRSLIILSTIIVVSLLAGGGTLSAQQGGGRGWGMGPDMMGPGWRSGMMDDERRGGFGRMMGMGCPMIGFSDNGETTTFIDGRIAFLKAELKIIEAQKEVWDNYVEALKANLQTMTSMHQIMQASLDAKTPVERLDTTLTAMETRLNALQEMKPALEKLYAALDDSQKEKANEVLTVMGCMM